MRHPGRWACLPLPAAAVAGLSLGFLSAPVRAANAAPVGRPNFVFFLVDDLRHDAMSCAGHPFVKTPNIDRIATGGVRFANAFVTISLCAPSRACFLTGMYAHSHGVTTNEGQEVGPDTPTFAQLLQKAGYETGFVGKWHQAPRSDPRPGFDYWFSFRGQGEYIDPQVNENGRAFKAQGYMTDILTDRAVEFIRKNREKPFALCVWHKAVHGPFTPAERHKGLYANARMAMPESFDDTFESKPQWQRDLAAGGGKARASRPARRKEAASRPAARSVPRAPWNPHPPANISYFEALAAVDDGVGRVMAALKEAGRLDNTVILFAGDNGFFMGEHRRGDKRLAYEESIRIPFVMCGPGVAKPGSTRDQMVLNIDFAPTLLDLAGVAPPATMQGRSLKPILAGENVPWRTSFLYEYYREKWLPGIPTMVGVRTTDWKYVRYPEIEDIDELYDLRNDPHEMKNLAADPAARGALDRMKAEFQRVAKETGLPQALRLKTDRDRQGVPSREPAHPDNQ